MKDQKEKEEKGPTPEEQAELKRRNTEKMLKE